MNQDIEILETVEPEIIETEPKPKKSKAKVEVEIIEDVILPVFFIKPVSCAGKMYKRNDIAEILKSELDKLPEKSYLVRNIKK